MAASFIITSSSPLRHHGHRRVMIRVAIRVMIAARGPRTGPAHSKSHRPLTATSMGRDVS